jgi:uncharacterized membrane protein YdfJ with MMPL/SSD domain
MNYNEEKKAKVYELITITVILIFLIFIFIKFLYF